MFAHMYEDNTGRRIGNSKQGPPAENKERVRKIIFLIKN